MNRHLAFLVVFLFALFSAGCRHKPIAGTAQDAPRFEPPQPNINFLNTEALITDFPIVDKQKRDMLVFRFFLAKCAEKGICPTLSALKNVPDGNIGLYAEREGAKRIWLPDTTTTKWRAFLDETGIPDPPNTVTLDHIFILLGTGKDFVFSISVTNRPPDPEPFLFLIFDRNAYTREAVQNLALPSLRGSDFFDGWVDIAKNPQWNEKEIACETFLGPAELECKERERERMELLGKLVVFSAYNQKVKLLLPGIKQYNSCVNETLPEEMFLNAKIGKMAPDAFLTGLMSKNVAPETAARWAKEVEKTIDGTKAKIEDIAKGLEDRGVPEEEAIQRATTMIADTVLREIMPEVMKNPDIGACASFLWDLEASALRTMFKTSEILSNDMARPLLILPDEIIGYARNGKPERAIRNALRTLMRRWYEKSAGTKVVLYNEALWKNHP